MNFLLHRNIIRLRGLYDNLFCYLGNNEKPGNDFPNNTHMVHSSIMPVRCFNLSIKHVGCRYSSLKITSHMSDNYNG